MERLQLIKWHAEELYKLLLEEPNNPVTARVAIELETVFINSLPYKNIEAKAPDATK